MSGVKQQLLEDMKAAMRARDATKLGAIRFLLAQVKNAEIDTGELSDDKIFTIIKQQLKQFDETIAGFQQAGRAASIKEEQVKRAVVAAYLPQQMSDNEIRAVVAQIRLDSGESHFGKLTGLVMRKLGASADGTRVSQLVQAELA